MDKFIATLNIDHLRKQAAEEPDAARRKVLLDLLAREEASLAVIVAARVGGAKTA